MLDNHKFINNIKLNKKQPGGIFLPALFVLCYIVLSKCRVKLTEAYMKIALSFDLSVGWRKIKLRGYPSGFQG